MTNKAALICCVQTLKRLLLDEQQPHRSMIGTAIMVGEKVIKENETVVEGAEQGSATTMTPLRLAEMRLRNCYTNHQGEAVGVHIVTRDRHEHERDYPIVGTVEMWSELIAHLSKVVGQAVLEIAVNENRRAEEAEKMINNLVQAFTPKMREIRASFYNPRAPVDAARASSDQDGGEGSNPHE